jgi:IS605 OrfB family transposase
MLQTYRTKPKPVQINDNLSSIDYFDEYGAFFGKLERKLFVMLHIKKNSSTKLKNSFLKKYGITSRQYNSIKMQLDGKIKSYIEKRELDIEQLESKIEHLHKVISKKEKEKKKQFENLNKHNKTEEMFRKKVKKYRSLKLYLHQKKRKLRNLEQKLQSYQSDKTNDKIRICFGSKKLFRKQFYLEDNRYASHLEWKKDWQQARSAQFLAIGSKDETYGNQTVTYDTDNNLRIRVADRFKETYGKYMTIPNVTFPYGQKHLDKAKVPYIGITRGGKKQKYFRSITYRFQRRGKGWYVNATVDIDIPNTGTSNRNGLIGIDLNAGFIAICEIDRFGNPIKSWNIHILMYARTHHQISAALGDAIKQITDYAILVQKDIVIEKLNFSKKKNQLREMSTKQARILSGFVYSRFKELLESRAKKQGVYVRKVNPAYTSQIGHMKFMARYGLSSHCSAACVIARRGYDFRIEKPKYDTALSLPKNYNKEKSNFSNWASIARHFKKEYDFHHRIELLKVDI